MSPIQLNTPHFKTMRTTIHSLFIIEIIFFIISKIYTKLTTFAYKRFVLKCADIYIYYVNLLSICVKYFHKDIQAIAS